MWIIKRKTNKNTFSNDLPCQKKISKWLPAKVTKRSHSFIINKFYWQFICIMCLHNAWNWFASQRKHCAIEPWWPNHITDTKDHYLCGETIPTISTQWKLNQKGWFCNLPFPEGNTRELTLTLLLLH